MALIRQACELCVAFAAGAAIRRQKGPRAQDMPKFLSMFLAGTSRSRGPVIDRRMTMTKMLAADQNGPRFVGIYGFGKDQFLLNQKLTPARGSVQAVVADLAERQAQEGALRFVQIIDLSMLEPVEPYQETLARLHAASLN